MAISDPGRGLVRRLGVTAAALLAFAAASQQRAEALSLASPGTAPSAKFATDDLTTEVRHGGHGGGGGGFRGGGGGGFRGGGGGFRGGGFMAVDSEAAVPRSMAAGSEAVALRSIVAAFAPRPCSAAAACATEYRHVYHRPHFHHRHHFHRRFYAPSYYAYPYYYGYRHRYCRVIWTYYGPRKICRYRPWYRHHWRHRYYGDVRYW